MINIYTLPYFLCVGIFPIPLHRCLQRFKEESRKCFYWCARCGLHTGVATAHYKDEMENSLINSPLAETTEQKIYGKRRVAKTGTK